MRPWNLIASIKMINKWWIFNSEIEMEELWKTKKASSSRYYYDDTETFMNRRDENRLEEIMLNPSTPLWCLKMELYAPRNFGKRVQEKIISSGRLKEKDYLKLVDTDPLHEIIPKRAKAIALSKMVNPHAMENILKMEYSFEYKLAVAKNPALPASLLNSIIKRSEDSFRKYQTLGKYRMMTYIALLFSPKVENEIANKHLKLIVSSTNNLEIGPYCMGSLSSNRKFRAKYVLSLLRQNSRWEHLDENTSFTNIFGEPEYWFISLCRAYALEEGLSDELPSDYLMRIVRMNMDSELAVDD